MAGPCRLQGQSKPVHRESIASPWPPMPQQESSSRSRIWPAAKNSLLASDGTGLSLFWHKICKTSKLCQCAICLAFLLPWNSASPGSGGPPQTATWIVGQVLRQILRLFLSMDKFNAAKFATVDNVTPTGRHQRYPIHGDLCDHPGITESGLKADIIKRTSP